MTPVTTIDGWFFDAYPVTGGMAVWVLDDSGVARRFFDPFFPSFYLRLEGRDALRLPALARRLPVTLGKAVKLELFSGRQWQVEELRVRDPLEFNRSVSALQKFFPHFAFYNSNIPVAQMYLYDRRVFPLARCEFTADGAGVLRHIEVRDSFDARDYVLPDLRIMRLTNGGADFSSKFFRTLNLELSYDGATHSLEEDDAVSVLESFNWHLYNYDPDIIITSWGDATLLPTILNASLRHRVPLLLNRDRSQEYFTTKERSYWTYGQIIHRDAAFMLAGRWHMDAENSFIMGESDIEGVIELARLTQLPMQKQSRAAIGTGLASMQMSYAYRNNILIPAEKKEGEDFKTADELLLSDRGGLVYMPEMGFHEEVAELDFASMYPSLMELHNISPETINCSCCDNHVVPELGYTICEKRRGIVPETLRPVLEKRAYYKSRRKDAPTLEEYRKYDRRQNALKWMLVTCFGYLGYKNARFGRIEAHESVNAYSREALLAAKEIAEADGCHLVHAIIDCLWLKKPGATPEEYHRLCEKIKNAVGVTVSFEGMYTWLLFPSSKTDPGIPTSGKYVGWYDHGEMKARGIEVRRKDTPWFIKNMQKRLLDLMSEMKDVREISARAPELIREAGFYLNELRGGRADPKQLVLRRRVQKEAGEYADNNLSAMVVRELAKFGVTVRAGEVIDYVIVDQSGKRDPQKAKSMMTYQHWDGYDIDKYSELLLKAVETLLSPFGYDRAKLAEAYGIGTNGRRPRVGAMQSPAGRANLVYTVPGSGRVITSGESGNSP
ncbi:MAG TPA: DNA polymerase domain-containing protein [Bacteroidota bacterium]|nr:DNA polymerase domain-containing protein [Bacteroidota bacterium]